MTVDLFQRHAARHIHTDATTGLRASDAERAIELLGGRVEVREGVGGNIHVCVYIYTLYIYMYMCVYIYIYVYIFIYLYVYLFIYLFTYIHIYTYIYI